MKQIIKLTIAIALLLQLAEANPSENDVCYKKFEIPYKQKKYPFKILIHYCINGYSYVGTNPEIPVGLGNQKEIQTGITQMWHIVDADKGISAPVTCSCK